MRARSGKTLAEALLTADRAALVADAPAVTAWRVADWAKGHAEIWHPEYKTGESDGNS